MSRKQEQTFATVGQKIAKLVEKSGLKLSGKRLALDIAKMIIENAPREIGGVTSQDLGAAMAGRSFQQCQEDAVRQQLDQWSELGRAK